MKNFSVSHSRVRGQIYVYNANDDQIFTIDESDFNELSGMDAENLSDKQIADIVGDIWKEEINDLA